MEINVTDIFGSGKLLEKLCDAIAQGTGRVTKAYFERKDIDNEVYRIRQIAHAHADAAERFKQIDSDVNYTIEGSVVKTHGALPLVSKEVNQTGVSLEARAVQKDEYQRNLRQLNTENVTAFAAEELKDETNFSDDPVDKDWINRFFRSVEDISNEDMQKLWGKILAGEVKQPNTFSLRTLEFVRNLSSEEAQLFGRLAKYVL
ncbi:MAG TPA: DUF2806 domain-containing protein, partial [Candidatus Kapabacteria bacterium]|nr:DUF2806 domain-containing protein [Candidatus Kapabacteria bacterium]